MFDWLHVSSHANWFHTFWSRTLALGLGCNLYRIQFLVSPGYQLKQIERISTEHELHFNSIRRTLWAVENKRTLTVLQVRPSAISTLHAISHKALTEFCHLCRVCGQSDSWREIGCVFLELKFYRCRVFFSLCCVCVCVWNIPGVCLKVRVSFFSRHRHWQNMQTQAAAEQPGPGYCDCRFIRLKFVSRLCCWSCVPYVGRIQHEYNHHIHILWIICHTFMDGNTPAKKTMSNSLNCWWCVFKVWQCGKCVENFLTIFSFLCVCERSWWFIIELGVAHAFNPAAMQRDHWHSSQAEHTRNRWRAKWQKIIYVCVDRWRKEMAFCDRESHERKHHTRSKHLNRRSIRSLSAMSVVESATTHL